jgi:hypothetical protein
MEVNCMSIERENWDVIDNDVNVKEWNKINGYSVRYS